MVEPCEFDYTVILAFPGFGAEREHAEAIVESALEWLNTFKDEPGFRFARQVSAHLELAQDASEVYARIAADESVAMVLIHELPTHERNALVRHCAEREIGVCYTLDAPQRARSPRKPWKVVIRQGPAQEPPAHRIAAETLTAPLGEDADIEGRVHELIAVLALGVMEHHFRRGSS